MAGGKDLARLGGEIGRGALHLGGDVESGFAVEFGGEAQHVEAQAGEALVEFAGVGLGAD